MKDLLNIKNETDRIIALYDLFDESSRLSSKATQIEFLTTVREIEDYLKPGMKILDLGAGTGEYSLYFANKGYDVTAVELVEKHVNQIKDKLTDDMNIQVYQGNALDLSKFDSNTFDIVLCFGPLYHLEDIEDRMKCIDEVKGVCKEDGNMFFAFIANDMIIATESMCYNPDFLKGNSYNHETFKVNNFPFVFHTLDESRKLLKDSKLKWKTRNPDKDGNMRDYATIEELIVMANLESANAQFIAENVPQAERLQKLNQMARFQLKSLLNNSYLKKLEGNKSIEK